jgi:hypothetical protein
MTDDYEDREYLAAAIIALATELCAARKALAAVEAIERWDVEADDEYIELSRHPGGEWMKAEQVRVALALANPEVKNGN